MNSHRLKDTSGKEFELLIDDSSQIVDVVGEWPGADGEFTLEGPLPSHANVEGAPDHIRALAGNGWEVCFYDPDSCRTCLCDGKGNMRCSGKC